MAKKLINISLTFTIKIDNDPGIEYKHVKTERMFVVGERVGKRTYDKKVAEMVEIEMYRKYYKVLEKKHTIESVDYTVRDGRKPKNSGGVKIWCIDTLKGKGKVKYTTIKDLCQVSGFPRPAVDRYLKQAREQGVHGLFLDRFAFSYDGKNFTSKEEMVRLEKLPVLADLIDNLPKHKFVVMDVTDESFKVFKNATEASKACGVSADAIVRRAANVALNLSNIEGKYAFWYEDEFVPGVSKPMEKVERTYLSIRVESVNKNDPTDIIVSRTVALAAETVGFSEESFRRLLLNRNTTLKGRFYRTIGSSCLLPHMV